jgi:uncharacterized membrane protein YeaQ/YmgE (transglycosylase-associated protein family)
MSRIFISYRRSDTSDAAGRLYDRLTQRFSRDQIFMDIDTIKPGMDFVEIIEREISKCDALIAIIGPHWITATDTRGHPGLENPNDFVRLEIATALERNIRVIPVLVQGALMPRIEELPPDLIKLVRRQAVEVRHNTYHSDVEQVLLAVGDVLNEAALKPQTDHTSTLPQTTHNQPTASQAPSFYEQPATVGNFRRRARLYLRWFGTLLLLGCVIASMFVNWIGGFLVMNLFSGTLTESSLLASLILSTIFGVIVSLVIRTNIRQSFQNLIIVNIGSFVGRMLLIGDLYYDMNYDSNLANLAASLLGAVILLLIVFFSCWIARR